MDIFPNPKLHDPLATDNLPRSIYPFRVWQFRETGGACRKERAREQERETPTQRGRETERTRGHRKHPALTFHRRVTLCSPLLRGRVTFRNGSLSRHLPSPKEGKTLIPNQGTLSFAWAPISFTEWVAGIGVPPLTPLCGHFEPQRRKPSSRGASRDSGGDESFPHCKRTGPQFRLHRPRGERSTTRKIWGASSVSAECVLAGIPFSCMTEMNFTPWGYAQWCGPPRRGCPSQKEISREANCFRIHPRKQLYKKRCHHLDSGVHHPFLPHLLHHPPFIRSSKNKIDHHLF